MNNVFAWEKGRPILAFIDKKGTIAGDLMKAIKFRAPRRVESMQEKLAAIKPEIGDVIIVDWYVFVVIKNHYRNKISEATMTKCIKDLPFDNLKTISEDYPQFKELFEKYNIEVFETSEW